MKKKTASFPASLLLAGALIQCLNAQQLFVSDLQVKFRDITGNGYCNDVTGADANYSFITTGGNVWKDSARIEFERPKTTYPGACLALCAQITCVNVSTEPFGIDDLTFEVFKYKEGGNALNPADTPPINTVSMYNVGMCSGTKGVPYYVNPSPNSDPAYRYCATWDGFYNLSGYFGKTNGQYGFRTKVKTNTVSLTAGNIAIEQTSAYPGQNQIPIQVDVTNIHIFRSSPTLVGVYTPVSAQPYNFNYRLSKDATTYIAIYPAMGSPTVQAARIIVDSRPRTGEGIGWDNKDALMPALQNGDFWDGRDEYGSLMPSGLYLLKINASSYDEWQPPLDRAWEYTYQFGLDPLQITDVGLRPLGAASTDTAAISYILTEAATAYVDIYPPGRSFDTVNESPPLISGVNRCDGEADDLCLRHVLEQQESRKTAMTYWDGRDRNGNALCDGNYVYALYASLPSAAAPGGTIWTPKTMVGTLPVARGLVVSLISPASSAFLSSTPPVAGLDPFYFRYTPTRDTYATLNIIPVGSVTPVRRLINREIRFAAFPNKETWDGKDDNGNYVSSGTYLAELVTEDPFQCASYRTSTATIIFPVNMFRIVDVKTTPLLGGASDTASISYMLTQTMFTDLKVYPARVTVSPSGWPNVTVTPPDPPLYAVSGIRPGRRPITQFWDGRDNNGLLVADGRYPFTLVAYTTGAAQNMYATDKAYGYLDVSRGQIVFTVFEVIPSVPAMYNSSETIKLPPYEIDYAFTRQSSVSIRITDLNLPPRTMANVVLGGIRDGDIIYRDFWDGKDDQGNFVPAGAYNVRIMAQDISSQLSSIATAQMTIEVSPIRIFDVAITPLTLENPAVIAYQLSEPMKVVTQIFRPGTAFLPDATPWPPASSSLVKRIIGVRPQRTPISEYWDGTDLTLSKVPDGNYVFKIFASTNSDNISSVDGSYKPGTALAGDIITANLPVTKSGTADLCGDFSQGTFFAPNPYTGTGGYFSTRVQENGTIGLKLYNLAGDLVYKYDFGLRGAEEPVIKHYWPKVNSSGRTVASGVYLAVIRFEATQGSREICQVVKKILIP